MTGIKIAVVSPSGTFEQQRLTNAEKIARSWGFDIVSLSKQREGIPSFLNGGLSQRLEELIAAESLDVQAIWCTRGGSGAIELLNDYQKDIYESNSAVLIGYSDSSVLHFIRFYRAARIGIHGPIFLDLLENENTLVETLNLLVKKQADRISYPALNRLNHFIANNFSGELIPMNLTSLQTLIGCFDPQFFRGKILAIEDVNEESYKIHRALCHLKNVGALVGLKALILGQFGDNRQQLIDDVIEPLASRLGIPLFDWPIFGHEKPNWPLLFGAKSTINRVDDQFFTLTYNEQHDHSPIENEL